MKKVVVLTLLAGISIAGSADAFEPDFVASRVEVSNDGSILRHRTSLMVIGKFWSMT